MTSMTFLLSHCEAASQTSTGTHTKGHQSLAITLTYGASKQLYTHGYPAVPSPRMYAHVHGREVAGELVVNDCMSVGITVEHLREQEPRHVR